jgi:hypothetical protein
MLKFHQNKNPKLDFKEAIKKPIPIKCVQIDEPFEVESMEGIMRGKTGDWLMIGINGEKYVCDDGIFQKSYDIVD